MIGSRTSSLFEHSLLPRFLVEAHASVILFVELALALWLLSGYRLALAWKSAAVPRRVPADVHPGELTPSADHAHARS